MIRNIFLGVIVGLLSSSISLAQDAPAPKITDYKVISEKKDRHGNTVKEVEYKENGFTVIKTIITPPFPKLSDFKPINPDTLNKDSLMILVEKDQYLVAVVYKKQRIRQYRAVFGPDRTQDKMMMGDRMTPEGWFKIVSKRPHNEWQHFVLLDYPNAESKKKFEQRKREGLIPANASIGHSVGIHGTFLGGEKMMDMGIGWTDGCVALKPNDMRDLQRFCFPGVKVYIRSINEEKSNVKSSAASASNNNVKK